MRVCGQPLLRAEDAGAEAPYGAKVLLLPAAQRDVVVERGREDKRVLRVESDCHIFKEAA